MHTSLCAYVHTLFPGGIEPQPIKLEFTIYPAELWIWGGDKGRGIVRTLRITHNRTFSSCLHVFWSKLLAGGWGRGRGWGHGRMCARA